MGPSPGRRSRPPATPRRGRGWTRTTRTRRAGHPRMVAPGPARRRPTFRHRPNVGPVTIQWSPPARRVSTTNLAPMKTAANATQTATSPPVKYAAAKADGRVDHQYREARPGEVAAVAGTDQHAVQHEHDAGDRGDDGGDHERLTAAWCTCGSRVNMWPTNCPPTATTSPKTTPQTTPHSRSSGWSSPGRSPRHRHPATVR